MTFEQERRIKELVAELCQKTGMNAAHDYDGIDDMDDVILYLKYHLGSLPQKRIGHKYVVDDGIHQPGLKN